MLVFCLHCSSSKLNDDQKVILNYVSSRRQHFPPPLVVYGPFGTGKTETMAEAAIVLTTNNSDVRVLICTKTNQSVFRLSHLLFVLIVSYDALCG